MGNFRFNYVVIMLLFIFPFSYGQENITNQRVSVDVENKTLEFLFNEIATQTNLFIDFSNENLKNIKVESFVENETPLKNLLDKINFKYNISSSLENGILYVKGINDLGDPIALKGVVAIGYGEKSKQKVSTAVTDVDVDILKNRSLSNATTALQGASPGLNISNISGQEDDSPRINIRGFTSINGGSPLVLIDGVEGNLNAINPSDIKSISVLKDAGAAAIYGARGAFGVVLVQTKKAKKNRLSVNISSAYTIISPTNNTDYLTDPYQSVMIVDESFKAAVGRAYTGYSDEDYKELKKVSENPSLARIIIANRKGKDQYVQ